METSNLSSSNTQLPSSELASLIQLRAMTHEYRVVRSALIHEGICEIASIKVVSKMWFYKVKDYILCSMHSHTILANSVIKTHTHSTHTCTHTHTANTCKSLTNQDCKQRHSWLAKSHPCSWKFVPSGHTCLFTYYSASSIHWLRTCLRWGPEPLKRSSINLDRALKEQLILRE